jgi:hypothetical protein
LDLKEIQELQERLVQLVQQEVQVRLVSQDKMVQLE